MKAKILLLLILSSIILCCRTKHKITTLEKESRKESEKVKVDSFSLQNLKTSQSKSTNVLLNEKNNEISGDLLIQGESDVANPFVFHNVVGGDTIQLISIIGNAKYAISNHYAKAEYKKTEVTKEKSNNSIKDSAHRTVSKETIKEAASEVSEETKKIKVNGFEVAAWIFITILGITLILLFFTYKYLKK